MGADMIVEAICVYGTIPFKEREIILLDAVKTLTLKDIKSDEWRDYITELDNRDLLHEFKDYTDEDKLEEHKKIITEIITNCFLSINGRETTYLQFPDYHLYVTGGMSWGDANEAYYDFEKFMALPESFLNKAEMGWVPSSYEMFMKTHEKKLPPKLKKDLELFHGAIKI